jgi:DNA-binding NarL/FixJ family response regulator
MEKVYKILLIDDDEVDRSFVRRYLSKSNFSFVISECSSGSASLKECEENKFDCIFLDYNLLDMDGIDVLEKILHIDPYVSVVFLTGMSDELLAVQAIKNGAADYLAKDGLSSVVLAQCIQNLEMGKPRKRQN